VTQNEERLAVAHQGLHPITWPVVQQTDTVERGGLTGKVTNLMSDNEGEIVEIEGWAVAQVLPATSPST
jgi:hypothetical protein